MAAVNNQCGVFNVAHRNHAQAIGAAYRKVAAKWRESGSMSILMKSCGNVYQ
jgi:hypothetical protein